MRALTALFAKELRQHALVGLALLGIVGAAYGIVLLSALANDGVTVLEAHAVFSRYLLPVIAVFLGHRLVVSEYFARTYLFLEGLPIPRGTFVTVKAVAFAGTLLAVAIGSQILMFGIASVREHVDAAYFGVVLARTATWTLFLFSFFFAAALAGRFRYPLFAMCALAAWALDSAFHVDASDGGPLALVDFRFVLERRDLPVEPLVTTSIAIIVMVTAGYVLALARGGTIAAALAGRLSARERSAVGAVVITLMIAITALEQEPLRFDPVAAGPGWITSEAPRLRLYHGPAAREADARRIFEVVTRDLAMLEPIVGRGSMPPVFVVLREGLAPDELDLADESKIPVIGASPRSPAGPALRAAVTRQVLLARSEGRADFEPYAWLLPGFSGWFGAREEPAPDPQRVRRALYATRGRGVTSGLLRRWHRTREQLGEPIADALAESGLHALEARHGEAAVIALGQAFADRPARSTSYGIIDELLEPPEERFERATGVAFSTFLAEWNAWLREQRPALPVRATRATAAIESIAGEGALRTLRARVDGTTAPARIRHVLVGPFDDAVDESVLATSSGEVVGVYAPGERVLVAVEVDDEALGCPLRLFARRFEVR